ncbi:unnamed protein product [Sphagnum troendelagicum]
MAGARGAQEEEEIGKLLLSASQGDLAGLETILQGGLAVDSADYDGRTALHLAASEGHVPALKLLLKHKPNVNPVDRKGDTPLANAVEYGHTEICKILREHGGVVSSVPDYEIPISELEFKRPIGKGAFGEICVAKWRGTTVAAKTILAPLANNPQIVKEFIGELAMLAQLSHPNVVQFLGAVTKTHPLVMVTEYLPKGDLYAHMEKSGRLEAGTAVQFALDIARGMNYLHQHKPEAVVHRDLKPRNLLENEAGHLKVADFGLGKFIGPVTTDGGADLYEMTGETGSYRYMAPEVFLHKHYNETVDIFSFGIIVQEMFEGGPASRFQYPKEIAIARAKEGQRPPFTVNSYPKGMKQLLKECWDHNPEKRPTFANIITRLEEMQSAIGTQKHHSTDAVPSSNHTHRCSVL